MSKFCKLRGTPVRLPLSIKLLIFICIFSNIYIYSQDLKIQYLYSSIDKNSDKDDFLMTLRTGKEFSFFYNEETFKADSITRKNPELLTEINLRSSNFYVIRKNRSSNNIVYVENVWRTVYKVTEDISIPWKILPDTDVFLGYKIQKATGEYEGRNWEVWFAPDIPISDGPYKFFGLPGMILKAYDDKLQHTFKAVSLKKMEMLQEYPFGFRFDYGGSLSYSAYKKIKKSFIENPETQMDNILDQNPNNRSAIRKQEVDIVKKINSRINPIELY